MTDLRARVTAAFGGRLVIERELGGGGMSRVFVASEPRIGRRVVVKVLPPELSVGLSADRFRREIEVAARLQHPHVVPLLDVGAEGDIIAFTMPYVEGESLRARLTREGGLPLRDAVRLWREILDALSHAHANGVVHRDIKPENILLSGKHAVVTDFGVAKALRNATAGDDGITGTGVSLGTPAYMAPEQVLGSAEVDQRSDLYSAALVMWEMVAGRHPFVGLSGQELLGAHLLRTLPPLREMAPQVPETLSVLLARCLAKTASERPSSADEVLSELEAIEISGMEPAASRPASTSVAIGGAGSVRRRAAIATSIVLLGLAGAALTMTMNGAKSAPDTEMASRPQNVVADSVARVARALYRTITVLVAPGPPGDSILRRQAQEVLASTLRRDTTLLVPTPQEIDGFMRSARISDRFLRDPDTLDAVAREFSHAVVRVELAGFGPSFTVGASLVHGDRGTIAAAISADAADSAALLRTLRSVGDSLLRAVARVTRGLDRAGSGRFASPASVRLMIEANDNNNSGNYERAVELARAATRADPNNVDAWLRLGGFLVNAASSRAERLDAFQRAYDLRHRATDEDELMAAGIFWVNFGYLDSAAAAYSRLAELQTRRSRTDPGATHNMLAVTRLAQRDFALAERAARVDVKPWDRRAAPGLVHYNLAAALLGQGRLSAVDSLLLVLETYDSTSPITRSVRFLRADAVHDVHALERIARDQPSRGGDLAVREHLFLSGALYAQGRFRDADSVVALMERQMEQQGDPGRAMAAALSRIAQRVIRGDTTADRRSVEDTERRYSSESLRFMDRYYDVRVRTRALIGDVVGATALLSDWDRTLPTEYRQFERDALIRARAEIALAAGQPAEALAYFQQTRIGRCVPCDHLHRARAFDAMRQPDSAIAHYTRYLDTPGTQRQETDREWLAMALRRLGELHEERREWGRALARYEEFVALWQNADATNQDVLRGVKARITEIRRRIG